MRERPILFSAPMVRSILAGKKTQTRRAIPADWWGCLDPDDPDDRARGVEMCRYGKPGDRLWVREAWRTYASLDHLAPRSIGEGAGIQYECGGSSVPGRETLTGMGRVRPGMFMPRWASRITLEVVDVRVERLQSITVEDAMAEGFTGRDPEPAAEGGTVYYWQGRSGAPCPRAHFHHLWQSIHSKRPGCSWTENPWVFVISFRRLQP